MKTPDLGFLNSSKLPGVSPYAIKTKKMIEKRAKEEEEEPEETIALKKMYPGAKTFCPDCGAAIFEEGGGCPSCQ